MAESPFVDQNGDLLYAIYRGFERIVSKLPLLPE